MSVEETANIHRSRFIRGKLLSGLLVIIQVCAGLSVFAGVVLLPRAGKLYDSAWLGYALFVALIVVGSLYLVAANAVWIGKRWGFYTLIVLLAISCVLNLRQFDIPQAATLSIIILVLIALVRPKLQYMT
jgi:hypothetical protein